jgi:maleylacetoacetate isomerase
MNQENQVILYSYFRSSASFRVRIALALKDIPTQYKFIHLLNDGGQQNSADFSKLNPMKHVPALVHGDFVLSESMAILKYLDHVKPTPKLFPSDAKKEAKVLQVCEMINSGIQPLQNLKVLKHLETLGIDKDGQKAWVVKWATAGLTALDQVLEKTSGTHCFGDEWSAADCLLVPQIFAVARFGITPDGFKTLSKIYSHLEKHPAVQKAHPMNQPDTE